MQPYLTPGVVRVGDPIQVSAGLTEAGLPVTGATVSVQVTSPSGSSTPLDLLDDGQHGDADSDDGDYGRIFSATGEEGNYQIYYHAEGTSRDGEPVIREANRSKYVESRIRPQPSPEDGGANGECCDKLVRLVEREHELLARLLQEERKK